MTDLIILEGDKPVYASQLNANFASLSGDVTAIANTVQNITPSSIGALPISGGTINGALTTKGNITVSKSGPQLILKNTAQTAGTPPQSSATERIYFQDSADTTLGQVANVYNSDGSRYSTLTSAKGDGTGNAYLRVGFDASGKVYTYAPTPVSGANENTIATIGWVGSSISGGTKAGGNDRTVLFSSNVSDGNITLSEAFTDFHQIIVMGTADGGTSYIAYTLDTYWLNWMLSNTDGACIFTGGNHNYWFIKNYNGGTTPKKFVVDEENCRIRRIIGINRK